MDNIINIKQISSESKNFITEIDNNRTVPYSPLFINTKQVSSEFKDFITRIDKNRIAYGTHGASDGFYMWFSSFILGLSVKDAYWEISDEGAANEFRNFESTSVGFLITMCSALALGTMACFGSYCQEDDEKTPVYLQYLAFFWPYIRESIKAFKWAYRGIRSTLQIILNKEGMIHSLFYFAVPIGIVALITKALLRYMRDGRKKMMTANNQLFKDIKKDQQRICFMDELEENMKPYAGTFVCIHSKKQIYFIDDQGTSCLQTADVSTKFFSVLNKLRRDTIEAKLTKDLKSMRQKEWSQLKGIKLLDATKLEDIPSKLKKMKNYKNHLVYILKGDNQAELAYVNEHGDVSALDSEDNSMLEKLNKSFNNLTQQKQSLSFLQTKTLLKKITPDHENTNQYKGIKLFDATKFEQSEIDNELKKMSAYKNHLIYIVRGNNQVELASVNEQGELSLDPKDNVLFVELNKSFNDLKQQKQTLSFLETENLLKEMVLHKYINDKKDLILRQNESIALASYAGVLMTAIPDGLAFYMGIVLLADFSFTMYIAMLAISLTLFVSLLVVRLHEEYYYQSTLKISQLNVELELSLIEIEHLRNILSNNLEQLEKIYAKADSLRAKERTDPIPSNSNAAKFEHLFEEEKKSMLETISKSQKNLFNAMQHHQAQEKLLSACVIPSNLISMLRGLQCGLYAHSFFAVATVFVINLLKYFSISCPPALILGLMTIGIGIVFMEAWSHYKALTFHKLDTNPRQQTDLIWDYDSSIKEGLTPIALIDQANILIHKQELHPEAPPSFEAKSDLWEIGRAIFSGACKGFKNWTETFDLFVFFQSFWLNCLTFVFSIAIFGLSYGLRSMAKYFSKDSSRNNSMDAGDCWSYALGIAEDPITEPGNPVSAKSTLINNTVFKFSLQSSEYSAGDDENNLSASSSPRCIPITSMYPQPPTIFKRRLCSQPEILLEDNALCHLFYPDNATNQQI